MVELMSESRSESSEKTILEQVGGREAVELVVADFYGRVLQDPRLAGFFRGVHMSRMQNLQVEFFAHVLGGEPYFGRDLVSAHRGMNIQDAHFDAVAGHLKESLEAAGVPEPLVGKILAIVATVREQITQPEAARKVG